MLSDVVYLKYDNNTILINEFYKILFEWRREKVLDVIIGYSQLKGNAVNEEMRCYFSNEFHINDEEYFGDTGVAFYFDYPAVDEDCIIILSNQEFYQVIKKKYMEYLKDSKMNEEEILKLLDEIKCKLSL
jgi:hypothetical protein